LVDCLIDAGFLEKNRDTLSADLLQVIQASSFKFVTGMFKEDFSAVCKNSFFLLEYGLRGGNVPRFIC